MMSAPFQLRYTGSEEPGKPWAPHPAKFETLYGRHPTLALAMRREHYQKGASTGCHAHQDFLALYAVRGGTGVHCIDQHPYGLARGDVYLMPAGSAHDYRDFKDLDIEAVYFRADLLLPEEVEALRELPGFWRLFVGEAGVDHRLHLAPEPFREVEGMLEELHLEWREPRGAGPLLLRQGFFRLLVRLARLTSIGETRGGPRETPAGQGWNKPGGNQLASPRDPFGAPSIAQVVRYCETHFAEPLSVPELARQLFLSPGHFSELFREEMGLPPAAFLRKLRLEKARALLRDSNLPVAVIAQRTGFVDAPHFSRSFRARYGQAPLQYRKQFQRSAQNSKGRE